MAGASPREQDRAGRFDEVERRQPFAQPGEVGVGGGPGVGEVARAGGLLLAGVEGRVGVEQVDGRTVVAAKTKLFARGNAVEPVGVADANRHCPGVRLPVRSISMMYIVGSR